MVGRCVASPSPPEARMALMRFPVTPPPSAPTRAMEAAPTTTHAVVQGQATQTRYEPEITSRGLDTAITHRAEPKCSRAGTI